MGTIFMNTENRKTNEPHKFILNMSQKLHLVKINMLPFKTYIFFTLGKI